MMKNKLLIFACMIFIVWLVRPQYSSAFLDTRGHQLKNVINLSSSDPDLESGFPVRTVATSGIIHSGQSIHTLVGNIDLDPQLEIANTAIAAGPLYIWNHDSSLVTGWPTNESKGSGYPSLGNIVGDSGQLEVVAGYFTGHLSAYALGGSPLPGWPYYLATHHPPSLADVNGDGLDEIFVSGTTITYAFFPDGTYVENWPVRYGGHTPAIADLDKDGDLEIVFSDGGLLVALHHNGEMVNGFPINHYYFSETFPVIGDVDGDGDLEIVIVQSNPFPPVAIGIYSVNGILENLIEFNIIPYDDLSKSSMPALADMDGDQIPEIIVQTNDRLHVVKANGTYLPGWPVTFSDHYDEYWISNSSPVIGDVDGDQLLDIAITLTVGGSVDGEIRVYNKFGILHSHFPKYLILTSSAVPAIADLDLDGRNEIIVSGYMAGGPFFQDHLWVYDLGGPTHGKIEWGQFGGGPHHRGVYPVPTAPTPIIQPPEGNHTFLPLVSKPRVSPPDLGIHGTVTNNQTPVGGIQMELRFFDGLIWSSLMTITTSHDGYYSFKNLPSLKANQNYYIRTALSEPLSATLFQWNSRVISNFKSGHTLGISDFDLRDLNLVSPLNNWSVTIPAQFIFMPREIHLTDMYSLVLYDPVDGDPFYQSYPYRNTDGFILNQIPPGFAYNTPYAWSIWIVSPDEAFGIPNESRLVTFSSAQISPDKRDEINIRFIPVDGNEKLLLTKFDQGEIHFPLP